MNQAAVDRKHSACKPLNKAFWSSQQSQCCPPDSQRGDRILWAQLTKTGGRRTEQELKTQGLRGQGHISDRKSFPNRAHRVGLAPSSTHDSPARQSHLHSHCPRHTPRSGGCTCHCHSGSPEGSRWAALGSRERKRGSGGQVGPGSTVCTPAPAPRNCSLYSKTAKKQRGKAGLWF